MPDQDSPTDATLLIVPDCNVLIHGKALREIPWEELDVEDIEVVIVGPVIAELDNVKTRPGRPGRLARDISSDLRELLEKPDFRDVIRETDPRVTRRLWLGQKEGREAVRQGLDLTHSDQAIINRALWLLDNGRRVVFLTDDTLAAAHAKEFGLPYRLLPREWLRPREKDDSQKENFKLKAEIARLIASEPQPRGWFEDLEGHPVKKIEVSLKRFQPLGAETIEGLMERIERSGPMANITPPLAPKPRSGPVDIASLDAQVDYALRPMMQLAITKYEEDHTAWMMQVRHQLENLHIAWRRRQNWPSARFMAENAGNRPASDTLVEIIVTGNFHIVQPKEWKDKAAQIDGKRRLAELSIKMPPAPPTPRDSMSKVLGTASDYLERELPKFVDPLRGLNRARDSDAFYWRTGQKGSTDRMELECGTWRHQRESEDFNFMIGGSDAEPVRGVVTGRISASNVTTPLEVRLPVRLSFEDRPLEPIAEQMVSEFERVVANWRKAHHLPPVEFGAGKSE